MRTIYLAALTSVDQNLYEAAAIDGAKMIGLNKPEIALRRKTEHDFTERNRLHLFSSVNFAILATTAAVFARISPFIMKLPPTATTLSHAR